MLAYGVENHNGFFSSSPRHQPRLLKSRFRLVDRPMFQPRQHAIDARPPLGNRVGVDSVDLGNVLQVAALAVEPLHQVVDHPPIVNARPE